ncbi:3-dehydrosphinganine reductase [[Leptolyngbya] sp. PCC 7376]|uniref:SDR family oxidoreductase n=1 Tax=[Leptolyngbya] sp. PCC 7376 TaxID=111781 RepID=UPI00029EE071|nr:SDR family oxidoreductase [[Leptolyngbya] sp. PCC 7376]AFY38524.1 3-dehydrosphinganine reductase [[Leptolyngbya] sp. PCC 7376]
MQHAIITGGSSGIGKAIATLLLQQGYSLSLIARRPELLEGAKIDLEKECINSEQKILCFPADVSEKTQITSVVEEAIAKLGVPDLLITSAGVAQPGYFEEMPLEIFEQAINVNYLGTLYAIKAAIPAMKQRQKGRIVIISSGAALIGLYGYTAYGPSKFALRGLAESLRGELKCFGIGVSIVYPPDTDTPQLAAENETKPEETKQITGTAEMWQPDKLAAVILQGVEKQQFTIAPGLELTLLNRLHSLLAPVLNWYFDGIVRKVRGN